VRGYSKVSNSVTILFDLERKLLTAKLLFFVLTFTLLMGLLPMSHPMMSMQTPHMEDMMLSQHGQMDHGSANENSTGSCCDEIAPFSISCAFLIPQYAYIDSSGGSERIWNSSPVVQSISIEAAIPPPKA
jgi:hypothetical protein